MVEILTTNNVKAVIELASMREALHLKRVVFKELSKAGIDLDGLLSLKGQNLKDLDTNDMNLNSLVSAVFSIIGSEELDNALIECLSRSRYNREKITLETFEDEKAREDYYEVLMKCAEINLTPFFKGLVSTCNQVMEKVVKTQPDTQK